MQDIKIWEDGGRVIVAFEGIDKDQKKLIADFVSSVLSGTIEIKKIEGLIPAANQKPEEPPKIPKNASSVLKEKLDVPFCFGPYVGKTSEEILTLQQKESDQASVWLFSYANKISKESLKKELKDKCREYWITISNRDVSSYQKEDVLEFFETFNPIIGEGIRYGLQNYGYMDYHLFVDQAEIEIQRESVKDLLGYLKKKCSDA